MMIYIHTLLHTYPGTFFLDVFSNRLSSVDLQAIHAVLHHEMLLYEISK